MKKAVLFARVSTEKQTYERQLSDLQPLMHGDGYADADIAIVNYKESATKNDIASRKSIRELKEIIEKNPIEQVYVTEVSRLSRRGDVMYSVLALLEEHNIGLVIQTPTLIRTIENGKKNQMAHIILQFLYQVAEAESNIKLERQVSGYNQKKKEGKLLCSRVIFGYRKDKDGYAEIVEKDAIIVNEMFDRYISGESAASLYERYKHIVDFGNVKYKTGCNRVWRILQDETYIGKNKQLRYPRIVSDEKFEQARERRLNKRLVKTKHKYVCYCSGLVRINGEAMTPNSASCAYVLYSPEKKTSWRVNINAIDSLVWLKASFSKSLNGQLKKRQNMVKLRKTIETLKQKKEGIKRDIEAKEKEAERINVMFQKDRLTEEKYDYLAKKVEGEMKYLEKEYDENELAIIQVDQALSAAEKDEGFASKADSILGITDDELRRDIVKETIKAVNVTQIEKKRYKIEIVYNSSLQANSTFEYVAIGRYVYLYDEDGQDYTPIIENRIESLSVRKRKMAQNASNLRSKPL